MNKPRLLDLFCGAGGASVGYHHAGFRVIGVDIEPQPRYPFMFIQADALEFLHRNGRHFDAIHASPPCQDYTVLRNFGTPVHGTAHLLDSTRGVLEKRGTPYVIENVPGAPMRDPLTLCGTMFGLGAPCRDGIWRELRRHRLFESSHRMPPPRPCRHDAPSLGNFGHGGPHSLGRQGYQGYREERVRAMGVGWMMINELSQAIPPAYTEYLGRHLLSTLNGDEL